MENRPVQASEQKMHDTIASKADEKTKFDMELVAMKNTHHAAMKELLIGCDLKWARTDVELQTQFEFNFDADSR